MHKLFVPKQAVGANLVYFDLFNPVGSGKNITVHSVVAVVSGAVAVTGVVGADLLLTRTTAVGTGGTGATFEGTDTTACTISAFDCDQILTAAQVSARLTPSGGATAGAVLGWRCVFTEETSSAPYVAVDLMNPPSQSFGSIPVKAGTGIRVVQGAVASVGNIGFDVYFSV